MVIETQPTMIAVPSRQVRREIPILSYGFRSFFLVAGIYGGLGICIWLPLFFGDISIPTAFSPVDWHIHEMLYGYLPAVMAGFLLTAIPNWTGRLPIRGRPLAILVAAWLAGRVAIFVSAIIGPIVAGVVDVLFPLLIAAAAAREIAVGRNWRNLPPVAIFLLLVIGDAIFHIEDFKTGSADIGTRLGIAAAIALITLIGGRVIPSFTHNWLTRENPGRVPVPFGPFDMAALVISMLALVAWICFPRWAGSAVLMLIAGVAHAIRLGRWAGYRTIRDRLVLVLHVGYGFVPLGFILLAAAILIPQVVPTSAGIHAWTAGAIGTMTLAIMTRASLGHTGHRLIAGPLTQLVYVAVVVAALARIAATFSTNSATLLLYIAGCAWIAAFWSFAIGYGPLLAKARQSQ